MPRSGVLMAGRVFAPDSGCSGLALPEVVAIGVLVEKGGGGDIAPVLGCYVGERGLFFFGRLWCKVQNVCVLSGNESK